MIKKLIFIVLLGLCIGGIAYSYLILEKKTHLNTPVINCVPKDAALLLHVKKPLSLWANLAETNVIWDNLKNIDFIQNIDATLKKVDSTLQQLGFQKEKEITLSIHQEALIPTFLVAFSSDARENQLINKELNSVLSSTYQQIPIYKKEEGNRLYTCYLSPFTIISSSENTLHKSIAQLKEKTHLLQDSAFNSLYLKTNNKTNLQFYYNTSNLKKLVIPYLTKEAIENWETNGEWSSLDVILDNNQLLLNGLKALTIKDSETNSATKRIDINLLPTNLQYIAEYSFVKNEIPLKIANTLTNECKCSIETQNWAGNHLTEITFGSNPLEKAYLLEVKENSHLIEQLREFIQIDTAIITSHETLIYKIENSSLNTLFDFSNSEIYFCIHNSQLVFSSLKGLKQLTFEWKKNKHTKPNFNYSVFSEEHLAQKADFNWFSTSDYLIKSSVALLKPEYQSTPLAIAKQLQNNFQIGYQTNRLKNSLEHTALIVKTVSGSTSNGNELWELTLENPTQSTPHLLKNHKSNSLDLFIQDATNTIHLVNAAGRIKWSKKIEGAIIEDVQQVDIYGNNKYQMLFNTASHIHIVDINGNYLKGFPIKLDSKATSSVSIFDYDKNNNYRFWISCENLTTYNYDEEGKKVTGWDMPKSKAPIQKQFERVVFNQKDYIYSNDTKGNVYFLNRRGESIYALTQPLVARDNKLTFQKRASLATSSFIYQNDSTNQLVDYSLANTTQLISLDENHPKLSYQIIDIDQNNFIDYLAVFQNKIELYGMDKTILKKSEFLTNVEKNYSLIKGESGKYYFAIKSEDSDNLILLDAQLKQINTAIVTGSLNLSIGDLNSDGKLDVVTIINKETIKVYSLN